MLNDAHLVSFFESSHGNIHRFRQCSWLIALLFFCLCVALKLNGSSIGMREQELSERKASKGLLLLRR